MPAFKNVKWTNFWTKYVTWKFGASKFDLKLSEFALEEALKSI